MTTDDPHADKLRAALATRFGEEFDIDATFSRLDTLADIASHSTFRRYSDKPVEAALLRLLCACALSAPSKSDLQQCDLLIVSGPTTREKIAALIPDQPHVASAPAFL